MKPSLFGLLYVISYHVRRKARPLTRGLVLTNRCNLRCRHCRVVDRGAKDLGFGEVRAAIDAFHDEGGRCLYLEGGEPFLWHDGEYRLDDVVNYAHALGFISVVVYTNGTFPLATSADTVFISVDGLQPTHDRLRGKTFDRIMGRIRNSAHRSLYINFTINTLNRDEIEPFCEYVNGVANVRGVFFYFHTPYYGYDELYLEPEER
jgi:MoaA/NifB/PqqE/SkfB family radical SAM enzyme